MRQVHATRKYVKIINIELALSTNSTRVPKLANKTQIRPLFFVFFLYKLHLIKYFEVCYVMTLHFRQNLLLVHYNHGPHPHTFSLCQLKSCCSSIICTWSGHVTVRQNSSDGHYSHTSTLKRKEKDNSICMFFTTLVQLSVNLISAHLIFNVDLFF